jgi:hypothetical protein
MPMSPRLLRPIASGVHPEANAWRSAVVANGGSVSASTMRAVSKFCADIDGAGLRDRFFRFNLFCGTSDASLVAPRVPLYRGPSRTGTQYGNTIDTNVNFVQGDYKETGSGGGLDGNGSSKYLDTGLGADFPRTDAGDIHIGAYHTVLPTGSDFQRMVAVDDTASPRTLYGTAARPGSNAFAYFSGGNTTSRQGSMSAAGHFVGVDAVTRRVFTNGSESTTTPGASGTTTTNNTTRPFFVFAENQTGTPGSYNNGVLAAYHIGRSLTDSQVSTLYTILQAFQTALTRNV